MFSFFSYWQLNDLGQYGTEWWQGWLLTYALTAVLCLASCFIKFSRWVYFVGAGLAIVHAILRATAIQFEKTILYNPSNPAGNETGGLIIVCLWLVGIALMTKVAKKGE